MNSYEIRLLSNDFYNDYNLKLIELDYESIKRINEVMAKKIKKEE